MTCEDCGFYLEPIVVDGAHDLRHVHANAEVTAAVNARTRLLLSLSKLVRVPEEDDERGPCYAEVCANCERPACVSGCPNEPIRNHNQSIDELLKATP